MYQRHGAMSMTELDICRWPSSEHRQARNGTFDSCSTDIGPCFDVGTLHDESLRTFYRRQEACHRPMFLTSPCLPFARPRNKFAQFGTVKLLERG